MSSTHTGLIDLHRHLDGSVRLSTIIELADQHGISLPARDVESLRPYVEVTDPEAGLMEYIARFEYLTAVMVNPEACARIAYENVEDASGEGIEYVELRFSPAFMASTHSLSAAEVTEATLDGLQRGSRDTGIRVGAIGILSRTYGPEACFEELEALMSHREGLVALDLAGDEKKFPAHLFVHHFRRASDAGLQITVHAGEADGPHSVWSAIRDLGTRRIGHGFRSIEDPHLVEFLAENEIGLEICLTSNLQIGAVQNYAEHPAKQLFDAGVLLNLNTDNPAISGIDLPHEFESAAPAAGFDSSDLDQIRINARKMAFLGG